LWRDGGNPVAAEFYRHQIAQAEQPRQPETTASSNPGSGAWVIGVALTSDRKSIKLYNGRGTYNEAEFIAILAAVRQVRR